MRIVKEIFEEEAESENEGRCGRDGDGDTSIELRKEYLDINLLILFTLKNTTRL